MDTNFIPYLIEGNTWIKVTLYDRNLNEKCLFGVNDVSNVDNCARVTWIKQFSLNTILYTIYSLFEIHDIFIEHDNNLGFSVLADIAMNIMRHVILRGPEEKARTARAILDLASSQVFRDYSESTNHCRRLLFEDGNGVVTYEDLIQDPIRCTNCNTEVVLYLAIDNIRYVNQLYAANSNYRSKEPKRTFTQRCMIQDDNIVYMCLQCLCQGIQISKDLDSMYLGLLNRIDFSLTAKYVDFDLMRMLISLQTPWNESQDDNLETIYEEDSLE